MAVPAAIKKCIPDGIKIVLSIMLTSTDGRKNSFQS